MTDLIIGGETFRIDMAGPATGPVVMLSNALGTDLDMWSGQTAALTKHFRVLRYDSRGHGGSVSNDRPVSLAQLGTDVLRLLDALEIDQVNWLGLSMGGAVGLWLLAHAPARVDRAILANTAATVGTPETWNARITSVISKGMRECAATNIERWFSSAFAARDPARVEAIHERLRSASPQSYAACCAALRDMDLRETLCGIRHQVLIITGRHDPVVGEENIRTLVSGIRNAKHIVLDAKHMSNIEAEAAFNEAVVGFLTSKPAARNKAASGKTSPIKSTPAKRGGAGRRSNAARSPLKKAPAKRTGARTSVGISRGSRDRAAPAAVTGPGVSKKPAGKRTATRTTERRSTSISAARGPVKKTKAKKGGVKATVKRAAAKAPAKKLPAARRRPSKKPRRPSGRGKR